MLAHAENNRQPEQIPYPAETVIPFLQLTDDQYALLQTIYTASSPASRRLTCPAPPPWRCCVP